MSFIESVSASSEVEKIVKDLSDRIDDVGESCDVKERCLHLLTHFELSVNIEIKLVLRILWRFAP